MTYKVRWTAPARRDMARLPARVATAVIVYVDERLVLNPQRLSKELTRELAGLRSARNGDYRVLFKLTEDTLWVVRVDHRAHVYRA